MVTLSVKTTELPDRGLDAAVFNALAGMFMYDYRTGYVWTGTQTYTTCYMSIRRVPDGDTRDSD